MTKGKWYDIRKYNNVRWCSECGHKVGSNKEDFDFTFCPYCGDYKLYTEVLDPNSAIFAKMEKKIQKPIRESMV